MQGLTRALHPTFGLTVLGLKKLFFMRCLLSIYFVVYSCSARWFIHYLFCGLFNIRRPHQSHQDYQYVLKGISQKGIHFIVLDSAPTESLREGDSRKAERFNDKLRKPNPLQSRARMEKSPCVMSTALSAWKPRVMDKKSMTEDEIVLIFKDIGSIICAQELLFEKTTSLKDYSARIGHIFLELAPCFRFARSYVAQYQSITSVLVRYAADKNFTHELERIAVKTNGRDLPSYLITPVQRMPRYALFCKELLQVTPGSHSDLDFLQMAFVPIGEETKKFNAEAGRYNKQTAIERLQESIRNKFQFAKVAITYPECATVTFSTNGKGNIRLFPTQFLLVKDADDKKVKVIYDSGLDVFMFKY
jgi:hypothetical protein